MRWWLAPIVAAGVVAAFGGCTMVDSGLLKEDAEVGCEEAKGLGSYYLPKSHLGVEVWRGRLKATQTDIYKLQVRGLISRPDPEKLYCLDYLASPTAKDTVRVWKTDQGVLAKISSRAEDQSALIIKKIIQTIFTLIIGLSPVPDQLGRGDQEGNDWQKVFFAEYDPTDLHEVAFLNGRLTDFGFCLISQGDPELRRIDPNRYCERPKAPDEGGQENGDGEHGQAAEREHGSGSHRRRLRHETQRGIFYRPRMPYHVFLFARENQRVRGAWEFQRRATLDIENHAPVISVGVNRTYFAKRATVLEFSEGVLQNVHLYKSSELEELATIPMEIIKGVVQLPTQIVKFRIGDVNNEMTLKRAEAMLLQAQKDKLKRDPKQSADYLDKAKVLAGPQ